MNYLCPICGGGVVIGIHHDCPHPETVFIQQPPVYEWEVSLEDKELYVQRFLEKQAL